jgi:hypothetical protein
VSASFRGRRAVVSPAFSIQMAGERRSSRSRSRRAHRLDVSELLAPLEFMPGDIDP